MWSRKLDHSIFLEEEKYVWAETRSRLHWRLAVFASLAIVSGVVISSVL